MNHKIDRDTYIIPPNFIESGTFFGGMFKARNVIEAGILAFAIGVPVFSLLPLGLTARIIALCLTALPAALVALIGISGESLIGLVYLLFLRGGFLLLGRLLLFHRTEFLADLVAANFIKLCWEILSAGAP